MATIAVAKVGATLKIDGVEYPLNEGDIVNNMRYLDNGVEKTITGKVRVIAASTVAQNVDPHTSCPPNPYLAKYIQVTGMIIDSSTDKDAILTRITSTSITGMDSVTPAEETDGAIVIGPGAQYKSLDEAIASAEAGAVIKLAAGEYTVPLVLNKDISIVGMVPGVVLSGKITADGPADGEAIKVGIENVKLTADALVEVGKGVSEFTMKGCTFGAHNIAAKTMPISVKDGGAILLTIDGNTFEDQNANAYNLIDVYGALKDGSSISNNEFSGKCCAHNMISLYEVEEGAEIHIDNNHAVYSANMVRIGFRGTPKCKVVMSGNSYDTTDPDAKWAGLFLVQPYSTKTESFAGTEIYVDKTQGPVGYQLGYIFAGDKDMQWTDTNKPTIYINGTKTDIPNANPKM
ncbi:MAG: hypothetical protein NC311_06395 [Muribaculaceae bacterium]|nr:hypothetical protein [Muribaculaceae bacterium]